MLKKTGRFLEQWGYYLLALLCAGVIIASGLWMGKAHPPEEINAPAAADQSQGLGAAREEATQGIEAVPVLCPPVPGGIERGFTEAPIWDAAIGLWYSHPALDFLAEPGQAVLAMADGRAEVDGDALRIHHMNGDCTVYRGLSSILAADGMYVRAGEQVGFSGGYTGLEGRRLCIRYECQGRAIDFSPLLADD